jgi:hypothetical protein
MIPSVPPCTSPDTILGTGSTNALGQFSIAIMPPLSNNECIYAFDVCNDLLGPVECARSPAAAPALSPRLTVLALGMLSLIAVIGLIRLRRNL